jgi:hypothetical protein
VKNCHGIVCDREENLILLTEEVRNNFIAYDPSGKRLHKWGTKYPGAHGLPPPEASLPLPSKIQHP